MALYTTLASLSQTAASNVADGAVDAPSTIDQQLNLVASFIAQLRDGNGLTTGVGYLAQCRLVKSGSNLVLQRFNGAGLTINGVAYAIPSAGVSLAPTSLSAGTTYYIYAYMSAGTMTLEASTTTHATDSATGIEIKSGDATRTLVGMARIITGPAWSDTATQRYVVSWFNRKPIQLVFPLTAAINTTSTTFVEVNSSYRLEALTWANDVVLLSMNGPVNQTAVSTMAAQMFTNGAIATAVTEVNASVSCPSAGFNCNMNASGSVVGAADGYSYIGMNGTAGASGTAAWVGGGTAGARHALSAVIQG